MEFPFLLDLKRLWLLSTLSRAIQADGRRLRKAHERPVTPRSFPEEEAPEPPVPWPHSASADRGLHHRHSRGSPHQTATQRLGLTSPPALRPSWATFHLLSSLSSEMSEAPETSTASKSCSFQQESSLHANRDRSSTPELGE